MQMLHPDAAVKLLHVTNNKSQRQKCIYKPNIKMETNYMKTGFTFNVHIKIHNV